MTPEPASASAPAPTGLGPFFDISQELLCVVGLDGRVRAINPAWEGALGYATGDVVGRPFLDFLNPNAGTGYPNT